MRDKPDKPEIAATTAAAPAAVIDEQTFIAVSGARVHNLKNISFEIPHNAITVVTGVSGSGKSSLAFDTIYAEGQRRYIESLSAYARQFLERIEKPDVDEISGIAPAIAIKQKNSTRNPRSTVATATEIYDYLRLLYARAGRTFCMRCGAEVRRDTIDEIAARVLALEPGRRFYVLFRLALPEPAKKRAKIAGREAAPARRPASSVQQASADLQKRGFNRLYQDGRVYEFSSPETLLDVDFAQPVFVLVDRLAIAPDIRSRLVDSVEICYREARAKPSWNFRPRTTASRNRASMVFNERFECKTCGLVYQEPEPRLFSFNNPYGACPRCQGFGNTIDFDLDLVIPDRGKSINEGVIEPWTKPRYRALWQDLKRFARARGIPAGRAVPPAHRRAAQRHRRGRPRRGLSRREGLLRLARTQEIQAARARVPEPLSRLRHLPRMRRHAAAPRSARRARRRQIHHRSLRADRHRGAPVLRFARTRARSKPPSPTRFSKRFSSACASSTKSASTT